MQVKKVLNLVALIIALGCAVAHAEEVTGKVEAKKAEVGKNAEDQWFDLRFVGEEIIEEKKEIFLTPDQALELFQKEPPQFKSDWAEKLNQPIEPAPKARKIPPGVLKSMRKGDDSVFVKVMGFSKQFARIMILQRKGNYLWHHYEECLASFKIPRAEEIYKIFDLDKLEKIYSFRYKGAGYGSTPDEVTKALGKPDGNESFQTDEIFYYYYLQDDVKIEFNHYEVRVVSTGIEEWVKKEIKANGVNVTRH